MDASRTVRLRVFRKHFKQDRRISELICYDYSEIRNARRFSLLFTTQGREDSLRISLQTLLLTY